MRMEIDIMERISSGRSTRRDGVYNGEAVADRIGILPRHACPNGTLGPLMKLLLAIFALHVSLLEIGVASATHPDDGKATRNLRLPPQPFHYAAIDLPKHFREAGERFDNTPSENPISDHGATLGRVLFYDKSLSANESTSCASCHKQELAFTDDRKFSVGFDGSPGNPKLDESDQRPILSWRPIFLG